MTEYEKMVKGLIYNPGDEKIISEQLQYQDKLWEFNQLKPSQYSEKIKYLKEMFAECGENCYIEPPLHANWGGKRVHLGNNVYANFNLTLVDDVDIYIGNDCLFGPNTVIATAGHPIDPELRARVTQYNAEVHIGNNVWLGAGVIVMPGVTIGDNSVIGAGSIVTKDIPSNVVAFGNPCKVFREIGERDKKYYFKNMEIDWENL